MGSKGTTEFCWSPLGLRRGTRADVWHGLRAEITTSLVLLHNGVRRAFFQPSWQYLQAQKGHKIRINTFWTWHHPVLAQSYLQLVQEKCGISLLQDPRASHPLPEPLGLFPARGGSELQEPLLTPAQPLAKLLHTGTRLRVLFGFFLQFNSPQNWVLPEVTHRSYEVLGFLGFFLQ